MILRIGATLLLCTIFVRNTLLLALVRAFLRTLMRLGGCRIASFNAVFRSALGGEVAGLLACCLSGQATVGL